VWELKDHDSDVTESALSQGLKGRTYDYSVSGRADILAGVAKLPVDYAFAHRYVLR
jgi:hypothetical protein